MHIFGTKILIGLNLLQNRVINFIGYLKRVEIVNILTLDIITIIFCR